MASFLLPRTAFGRTAVITGLIVGLSQALSLWFFARNAYLPGIREYAELTHLYASASVGDQADIEMARRIAAATGIEIAANRLPPEEEPSFIARPVVDRFQLEVEVLLKEPVIVRMEETHRELVGRTMQNIRTAGGRVLGTFLTGLAPDRADSDKYGYYRVDASDREMSRRGSAREKARRKAEARLRRQEKAYLREARKSMDAADAKDSDVADV